VYWIAKTEAALLESIPWIEFLLIYGLGGLAIIYVTVTLVVWCLDRRQGEPGLEELGMARKIPPVYNQSPEDEAPVGQRRATSISDEVNS